MKPGRPNRRIERDQIGADTHTGSLYDKLAFFPDQIEYKMRHNQARI